MPQDHLNCEDKPAPVVLHKFETPLPQLPASNSIRENSITVAKEKTSGIPKTSDQK